MAFRRVETAHVELHLPEELVTQADLTRQIRIGDLERLFEVPTRRIEVSKNASAVTETVCAP